jgi:hypothetical protein
MRMHRVSNPFAVEEYITCVQPKKRFCACEDQKFVRVKYLQQHMCIHHHTKESNRGVHFPITSFILLPE